MTYEPEKYWNSMARRLAARSKDVIIAGDNSPFYRYKRRQFLHLFKHINFRGKVVLEIGQGPGGNLAEAARLNAKELHGADVSEAMIAIAKETLAGKNVKLQKVEGGRLPYADAYFDISYTVTVLQHNTDEQMLNALIKEICRVTENDIYIFERIETTSKGTELCLGRPVSYYQKAFEQESFTLKQVSFLNIQVSYLICGVIRKLCNRKTRLEGEKESRISELLQSIALPLSSQLDKIFKASRDLTMLHFSRDA